MSQTVIDIVGARTWTAVQSVTTAVVHCDRWYQRLRAELRPWRLPQAMSLFVGRVCGESEGARLSEGDLLLEGSLASSSGARVALDLSRLPAFRLFPGQARAPQRLSGARCLARSAALRARVAAVPGVLQTSL